MKREAAPRNGAAHPSLKFRVSENSDPDQTLLNHTQSELTLGCESMPQVGEFLPLRWSRAAAGREGAKAFGVTRLGPLPSKRATFVIDTDRRLVKAIRSEFNMHTHADEALDALRGLAA